MIRMIGPKLLRLTLAAVLLACAMQTPLLSENPAAPESTDIDSTPTAVSVLPGSTLPPASATVPPAIESTTALPSSRATSDILMTPTRVSTPPTPLPTSIDTKIGDSSQNLSIDEIKKQLAELQLRFASVNDQMKSNQAAAADAIAKLSELSTLLTQHQQKVEKAMTAGKTSAADQAKIKTLEQENLQLKAKLNDANSAIDSLAKLNRRYAEQIAAMESGKTATPSPAATPTTAVEPTTSSLPATQTEFRKIEPDPTIPDISTPPGVGATALAAKTPTTVATENITPALSDTPVTVELSTAQNDTTAVKTPATASIEGRISFVLGNRAAIDIGSNSGLKKGMMLTVVQDGKDVANLRIDSFDTTDAGGTILNATSQVKEGASVVLR